MTLSAKYLNQWTDFNETQSIQQVFINNSLLLEINISQLIDRTNPNIFSQIYKLLKGYVTVAESHTHRLLQGLLRDITHNLNHKVSLYSYNWTSSFFVNN